MKKQIIEINILLIVIISLLITILTILLNQNKHSIYDVNKDGKVSAQDYVAIKNYIMQND